MAVRQLFDNDNGFIVGFSIIVCEINPWVNREVYDGNMSRELPTYSEVWLLFGFTRVRLRAPTAEFRAGIETHKVW